MKRNIEDLNGMYMEPSEETLKILIEMGYTPISKNIVEKAIKGNFMFFIQENKIFYREESELIDNFSKVKLYNNENQKMDFNKLMKILNSITDSEKYKNEEKVSNEENFIYLDNLKFENPDFYVEILASKIDPNTQENVLIGFVLDNNTIKTKIWSIDGKDLNGDFNLVKINNWYEDENNFPAIVEYNGTYIKAVKYVKMLTQEVIFAQMINGETISLPLQKVKFIQRVN